MTATANEPDWLAEFSAEIDRMHANPPPASPGMELIECRAEPRHWPTYTAHVDGMFPSNCPTCEYVALREERDRLEHEAHHKRWQRWRITGWFARHAYSLGLIAGSGTAYNGCPDCPLRHTLNWRGRRPYILGVERETWSCLLRRHHRRTATHITAGLCSKCCPCPGCGSTAADHYCCDGEQ
jgi:hypothetical protein